jgi:hypothetical protein
MSQVTCSAGPQADDITYTDADLVAQLRAGDETAIAQLVDQWSPAMFRVARSFVDSPQSTEDVVQDAWLGMLRGWPRSRAARRCVPGRSRSWSTGEDPRGP